MGLEKSALRSVDSESESHAIELRKACRGSLCFLHTRGHAVAPNRSGANSPAGVGLEHVQTDNRGSPGTWEILLLPRRQPDGDTGLPTPGPDGALVRQGANTTSATEVSPNEGNEVRRDGHQEVIAS